MESYMAEKNRKLRDQFDSDASSSCIGNGIFRGVSIFADGFTVPSSHHDEDKVSGLHGICSSSGHVADFIPVYISQVDVSVLQKLPNEVKADISGAFSTQGLSKHSIKKTNLWDGDPPKWLHECQLFPVSLDPNEEEWDEASSVICALVIQYTDLKIKSNIEEIYICFQLLGRFAVRSIFFQHVYDKVLPSIQASVSDIYGGKLRLPLVN